MRIVKLSHEGRGIAYEQGKTQFILNALPDEEVVVKKLKKHARFDESIATEILEKNPKRVIPPCSHFLVCAGCSLQHLDPIAQIMFKEDQLKEQLKHFGHCEAKEVLPPLYGNSLAYRKKARLGVKFISKNNKVLVGFREINGRYIADLQHCPVLHPKFGNLIPALSELFFSLSHKDQIPQCECAMGDEDAAIIIRHLSRFTAEDLNLIEAFGKTHNIQIFLQPAGIASIHKLWPNDGNTYLWYTLAKHQLQLGFHPWNFTQVNTEMNQAMIDQALHLLAITHEDHVLDLFCGMGNFSLPIARYAKSVLGIEGDASLVKCAHENASKNGLTNTSFLSVDLNKEFEFAKNLVIHKVLLDPPRSGAFEILPQVLALNSERIVYVSCNPSTLARDAEYLTTHAYTLEKMGVIDMFPHTQHVESMALFVKKP